MKTLMFHSIGLDRSNWHRKFLSVSLIHFEYLCKYLRKKNYRTVLLDEWYSLQNSKLKQNDKLICLTFDDGYLDNWVFAYPILKKYGLKGTIFINPEFVDPSDTIRKNLEDFNLNYNNLTQKEAIGFLNWAEISRMDKDRILDVQSHTMSHNYYFNSEELIDIYAGQRDYDWLAWYLIPEKKPFYLTDNQIQLVPNGFPIFTYGRALGLRRYFPAKELVDFAIEKHKNGIKKEYLMNRIREMIKDLPGEYETDEEMTQRYKYELFESKRILEEKLNKKVDFLCWPGGGYNDLAIDISKRAGYKASTIGTRETTSIFNNFDDYKRIKRNGMGSFIYKKNKYIYASLNNHLVYTLKAYEGSIYSRLLLKFYKLLV